MLKIGEVGLTFLKRPKRPTIRVETPGKGALSYASFDADAFEVEAAVELIGSRSDGKGARLGWTQIQTVDVNRAVYKGATTEAGRTEVNRDRSTSAAGSLCRDVMSATDVFTCPPGTQRGLGYTPQKPMNFALDAVPIPSKVRVSHADKPGEGYLVEFENDRTRRINYLAWAKVEMQFCAVLILKRRDGSIEQLSHFYWSLNWEDRFEPLRRGSDVTGIRAVGAGDRNAMTFKPFVKGPVPDGRLQALITAAKVQTCNDRAYLRNNDPETVFHSRW